MAAISPRQLDTIAAFLETSRNYLDIEHVIRLHWPPASAKSRCGEAAGARTAKPARKQAPRADGDALCHIGV